jgi:hypothetical protein
VFSAAHFHVFYESGFDDSGGSELVDGVSELLGEILA